MTTIRNTVTSALRQAGMSQYMTQAEPIIVALEQRETQCIEGLRSYVVEDQGLDANQFHQALINCGFREAQQFSTPADGGNNQMMQAIEQLKQQVQALQNAARTAGLSV